MRRVVAAVTGLGTRLAARTFLVFAACAIAPILVTAFFAQRAVNEEMRSSATARLATGSKAYGLLVYDRLQQAEQMLAAVGRFYLDERIDFEELHRYPSARVRIVSLTKADATTGAPRVSLSVLHPPHGAPEVTMTMTVRSGDQLATAVGVVEPEFLWNADPIGLENARLCVRDAQRVLLNCTGDVQLEDRSDEPALMAEWPLFLRSTYGAESWNVQALQPSRLALTSDVGRSIPVAVGIALAIALLLSLVHIRRSHGPLALLVEAAARVSERRFSKPIPIDSDDEFGRVARAFNGMAVSVGRQFAVLAALGRIDRMILASPSLPEIVEKTLPELPALLRVSAAAMIVRNEDEAEPLLYSAGAGRALRTERVLMNEEALREVLTASSAQVGAPAQLTSALGADRLYAAPIRVDRRLRGALLLARSESEVDHEQRRHARSFARRFAVALGAEERRRALLRQAYYDHLTGLPNRQLFKDRLHQKLAHARRSGENVAVIYIDLDRFKNINDSLGHSAGDQLLRVVSARLSGVMREIDTLARLGGDEFVVIASGVRESPAHLLAERLQNALRAPVSVGEVRCVVEASIGIAVYPQDGDSAEVLLRNADTAMYRAKASGGGCAVYFEEEMNVDAMRRLRIEQRLRAALARRELQVVYQPKISLQRGTLFGVEALARWRDAELGEVSPAEFIPAAEECGLIEELGEWVMREACLAYQSWRGAGLDVGHVGVNVSMHQLNAEHFTERVSRVLRETQTPPHALELEVTESTLAERPAQVSRVLDDLRATGVRIAIDDFGVGYSSMATLGQLPADVLKIDKSFIEHCAERGEAASIVEAIISMAHALGKLTVAEGVETSAQLQVLRSLGCDVAQGYYFSTPIQASQIKDFTHPQIEERTEERARRARA